MDSKLIRRLRELTGLEPLLITGHESLCPCDPSEGAVGFSDKNERFVLKFDRDGIKSVLHRHRDPDEVKVLWRRA